MKLLTIEDLAASLGVSIPTIRRDLKREKIKPAGKIRQRPYHYVPADLVQLRKARGL